MITLSHEWPHTSIRALVKYVHRIYYYIFLYIYIWKIAKKYNFVPYYTPTVFRTKLIPNLFTVDTKKKIYIENAIIPWIHNKHLFETWRDEMFFFKEILPNTKSIFGDTWNDLISHNSIFKAAIFIYQFWKWNNWLQMTGDPQFSWNSSNNWTKIEKWKH